MENNPQNEGADQNKTPHNVNFFKPVTEHAKANMKLISLLVVVWAVAVFGFQALLVIMQKPVAEPSHAKFIELLPTIKSGVATREDHQAFARITLAVLGKNIVLKASDKQTLTETLSTTVLALLPETDRTTFAGLIEQDNKTDAAKLASKAIGLEDSGFDKLMAGLLPYSLVQAESATISPATIEKLPGIMDLYLIHNQSILTDIQFLGFPFHYWYSAQFLLVMFVLLCLLYAVLIDRIHKKHGFIEE